jgi:hypothetical protein
MVLWTMWDTIVIVSIVAYYEWTLQIQRLREFWNPAFVKKPMRICEILKNVMKFQKWKHVTFSSRLPPFLPLSIPCEIRRWVPCYLYHFGTNKNSIIEKTQIFRNCNLKISNFNMEFSLKIIHIIKVLAKVVKVLRYCGGGVGTTLYTPSSNSFRVMVKLQNILLY